MPRWLRTGLVAFSFAMFFAGALLVGLLVFPLIRLVTWRRDRHRRVCTWLLHRAYPSFALWMRLAGLVRYAPLPLPEGVPPRGPYLLVANHPTVVDVVLLLGTYPGLTTVVKPSLFRALLMRPLLGSTLYLAGAGMPGDEGETPALDRYVRHLEEGHPLVIFPEGTRSHPEKLRRFKRGVFEVALRAKVPIVALYLDCSTPGLCREVLWPREPMHLRAELLEVVDPVTCGMGSKELRSHFQRRYEERFAATLARRTVRLAEGRLVPAEEALAALESSSAAPPTP